MSLAAEPASSAELERQRVRKYQRHVLVMSATAFVAGAVGAAAYGFKRKSFLRGPTWAQPPADEAGALSSGASAPWRTPPHLATSSTEGGRLSALTKAGAHDAAVGAHAPLSAPPSDEPSQSAWALFRELNSMIFATMRTPKKAPLKARAVPLSRAAGRQGAPPPTISALSRMPAPAPSTTSTSLRSSVKTAPPGIGALSRTPPAPEPAAESGELDEAMDGGTMAIKAFLLATALVASGAVAVAVIIRFSMDVHTLEEFTDKMHGLMPAASRTNPLARYVPAVPVAAVDEAAMPPHQELSNDEFIARLDSEDDPAEWLHIMRTQLDAEMATHIAEREARLQQRRSAP